MSVIVDIHLILEILLVLSISWIVWLLYAWRTRKLRVRALDHTNFYSFMVAVDVAMAVKGPRLTFIAIGEVLDVQHGTRVFMLLALLTLVSGMVGVWIDSKAEHILVPYLELPHVQPQSQWQAQSRWQAYTAKLRVSGSWHFWRWCHRAMLLVLSTLHSGVLVMVSAVTR